MIEVVREVLSEGYAVNDATLPLTTQLSDFADELDIEEIVMCLEEQFDATAPQGVESSLHTIGDVVDLANKLLWERVQQYMIERLSEMAVSYITEQVSAAELKGSHFILHTKDDFWCHVIQSRCGEIINDALSESMSVHAQLFVRCDRPKTDEEKQ